MQITGRNTGRASFSFFNAAQEQIVVQPNQEVTAEVDDYTGKLLQRMSEDPRSVFKIGADVQKFSENAEERRRQEAQQLEARHEAERRMEEQRAQQNSPGPIETDGQVEGTAPGQGGENESSGTADESTQEAEASRNRRRR
jgi:hypothetical protein